MAADLVARRVALIASGGGEPAAFAAKAATSTIPIVMVIGGDPVKEGLVPRLSRPGGNITGATIFAYEMESKRLGLLHEAVPAAKNIAVLLNPANPNVELQLRDVRETASRLGVEVVAFNAAPKASSRAFFALWRNDRRARCSSRAIHSSSAAARTLSHWPRSIGYRRSTNGVIRRSMAA